MATPVISDRYVDQACSAVFANSNDTCGSVTRESITYLTPDQIQSLFAPGGLWAEMDAWMKTAFEMKVCGTKTYAMYDWIYGNAHRGGNLLQTIKQGPSVSLLQPFVYGKQATVINDDYWNVDAGWANSAYTALITGPLTAAELALGEATDRVIRVRSSGGALSLADNWFNPGMRQFIITRTSGTVGIGMWEVIARGTAAADESYIDVLIKDMNGGAHTSANYEVAPTTGLLVQSNNNVNDYEKWCYNEPNYDGNKMVPQWIKTFRRTRCVDSEYQKFYARLMSGANDAFKLFGDMDLAKRNAQDELKHKKRFVHNFFFSVPSDSNQTVNLWQSLEDIRTPSGFSVDPGTGGKLMAKRAENIGVLEQLRRCNRVRDLQGSPLNMYEFWNEIYLMQRSRETNRGTVKEIDFYTDSVTAANFHRGMLAYWKKESQEMLSLNLDFNKTNGMGMSYSSYMAIFPSGVKVNIIVDKFFDDYRAAMKAKGMEEAGSIMTALDLGANGSVYWLQVASNRKEYTTGDVDKLAQIDRDWACVMESVTEKRTLISDTGAVVVECPQDQIWIWNYSNAVPITTGAVTTGESPYYHDLI